MSFNGNWPTNYIAIAANLTFICEFTTSWKIFIYLVASIINKNSRCIKLKSIEQNSVFFFGSKEIHFKSFLISNASHVVLFYISFFYKLLPLCCLFSYFCCLLLICFPLNRLDSVFNCFFQFRASIFVIDTKTLATHSTVTHTHTHTKKVNIYD